MWRNNCRLARDRGLAREAEEREARAKEEEDYPVVKATVGAVGDGSGWRGRREVSLTVIYLKNFKYLLLSLEVRRLRARWPV